MTLPRAGPPQPRPPSPSGGRASLADAVRAFLEGGADRRAQAGHLERVVDRLGDYREVVDAEAAKRIQRLLLNLADCPEPQEGGQGLAPDERQAARGLAARGLIRLYAHTRNKALPAKMEEILADRTDAVRCSVAADLHILFGADPALAYETADRHALWDLPASPRILGSKFRREIDRKGGPPIDIRDVLSECIAGPGALHRCVDALLSSALEKRRAPARDLLDRILTDLRLSRDIRQAVVHALGRRHLFRRHTQDGALEALLLVLDSEDPDAREHAAFVLTSSIGKRADDPAAYVQKIASHIDKMADEADRDDCNPKMLETLTSFLCRHCRLMPERALVHLERVAGLPEALDRPRISKNIAEALAVLLRTPAGKGGRRRCIAVLRRLAAAGHPGALDALRRAGEA